MTAPVESHRATVDNGPCVIDGELLWTSASHITTADPQSVGGCLRKWFYDTVQGKKAEATEAQKGGTALHAEIENHLLTGASLTSAKALAGRMFIDTPGSGLHIEKPIFFTTRDGIKIYGHVDLYNLRQRYIDEDGVLQQDPSWSFEVKDWKTTSDFQYAKSPAELAQNIQLVTYAEAGFREWPDLEHARLTHVYFLTKGRPASKLSTIRRSRDEITLRWEYAEAVTRSMRHAARETNADKVPANKNACNAYSGCPHRGICSEHNFNSLDSLYAKIGKDWKEPPGGLQEPGRLQTLGGVQQGQDARDLAGVPQTPQGQAGIQGGHHGSDCSRIQARPEAGYPTVKTVSMATPTEGVRQQPDAVLGAAAFSTGQVRDLSPPVRSDQNEIQPAYVGTLPHADAFSRHHMPFLQPDSGSREGQHSSVTERDLIPERSVKMGLLQNNPQILQQQPTDMRAQLAAEEAQQRAQAAQQQQQMPTAPLMGPQDLAILCQRIQGHGRGFPAVGGNALQAYAQTIGATQPLAPDFVFKGMGNLGHVMLSEVAHFAQLAAELDAQRPPVAQPSVQYVQPVEYNQTTQQYTPVAQQISAPTGMPAMAIPYGGAPPMSFLAPNAPESQPQLAAVQPSAPPSAEAPPAEEPKKGRGRPKKEKSQDTAPEAVAAVAAQADPPSQASAPATQAPPVTASASLLDSSAAARCAGSGSILVNARFPNRRTQSLASYVEGLNAKISARYSVNDDGSPGIQDVRCAPKNSPLGYAGWKGVVRECVKAEPPPEGDYHFDTFGDELNEIVANTLEVVAESKGWLFVRGVR